MSFIFSTFLKKRGLIIFLGFVIIVAIFYVYTKSTQLSSTMKVAETVAETTVSDNQNSLFDLVMYRDMRDDVEMQKCIPNIECRRSLYQASQSVQDELVRTYGSGLFDGIDDAKVAPEVPVFATQLEALTNGDIILTGDIQEWELGIIKSFQKTLNRPYVLEVRSVFDKYINGDLFEGYDKELLLSPYTKNDINYGLSSFDTDYFKSQFALMGVYPHYLGGYDLIIYFADKPDTLFRIWVDKYENDEHEEWKMRMFHDIDIPDDELSALVSEYDTVVNKYGLKR